jgi:hypothetical protein
VSAGLVERVGLLSDRQESFDLLLVQLRQCREDLPESGTNLLDFRLLGRLWRDARERGDSATLSVEFSLVLLNLLLVLLTRASFFLQIRKDSGLPPIITTLTRLILGGGRCPRCG